MATLIDEQLSCAIEPAQIGFMPKAVATSIGRLRGAGGTLNSPV